MYYDTRELKSLSTLKKIKKNPDLQAISEKDFLYACASITSYLIISNQSVAQDNADYNRQINNILKHNKELTRSTLSTHLSLTYQALQKHLEDLSRIELTGFVNFIIDRLIELITGVDHRHCKIVSGFAGCIFNHTRYNVVDVLPNIADLTIGVRGQGIKYSFLMSGQIEAEQKELINLKLHCNAISARFAASFDEFPKSNGHQAYLIDAISQDVGSTNPRRYINGMTSEEIYSQISGQSKAQSFFIMTRTAKGANSTSFRRSWNPYNQSIEAVVAFDSYHQGSIKKFLFIIINNASSENDQTLYINTSDNPAILSLDAIERSVLAASIYLSWRFGASPPKGMTQKVASILNSQFRYGYRDVNGLCKVAARTRNYNRYLFSVNRHVNFTSQTSLTEDHNSAELISELESKETKCLYIIGNNGAGKSLLLGRLASQLIEKKKLATGITLSQSNRFPKTKSEEYFTSFCLTQHSRHHLIETVPKLFSRLCCDTNKLKTLLRCLELLSFTQDLYLGAKPHSKKRATVDVDSLVAIGANALENEEALREVHQDSSTLILVKNNNPDHYVFFSDLSSGEQNIITLLILCIDSAKRGKVLLLDEPEISLHVSWQQRLPQILDIIAQDLHTSIVTATHSPLLISNAPVQHTFCYVLDTGKLNYIEPEKRRSVETSLLSIFNTYTPLNKEVYERCARLVALTIQRRNSETAIQAGELNDSLTQLETMAETVRNSSIINDDTRYKSDLDLISKARLAIMAVRDEDEHGRV
ncbi:ATP-binding cassette domain-containing protein [Pseudomonas mandelii]|uniref:AAA family ATPase n=1 Tax=Pseudomonas mandelii TaxID=75612 RepID=UPI0012B2DF61|nr:AAA family ATPase [Pseudomonas mandelii]MSU93969.1 ATP-binding cassette domain-containing protein [Pseudomonas mandelii]